jgi:hypothetical protein
MVDSFIIEMHLIGMAALGNSVLVFPRFQKNSTEHRRIAVINASVAIALFLTAIIVMMIAFSGPFRLLDRLINPAPEAITLHIFLVYLFSILIHFCLLVYLLKYGAEKPGILSYFIFFTVGYSVLILASILLFINPIPARPISLIIIWYIYFYSILFAGGQIFLFIICKINDRLLPDKCSELSINILKKQAVVFSCMGLVSGTFYFLSA